MSGYRLTVDYPQDFKLFKSLLDRYRDKIYFLKMREIINFINQNPKLIKYQKNY